MKFFLKSHESSDYYYFLILRPRASVFVFQSFTQCCGIKMPSAGFEPLSFYTWCFRIHVSNHSATPPPNCQSELCRQRISGWSVFFVLFVFRPQTVPVLRLRFFLCKNERKMMIVCILVCIPL